MLLLIFLSVFYPLGSALDLPPDLPKCYVDDPKINNCLLNATLVLKPKIQKGIKEIGIPAYDPLVISNFSMLVDTHLINLTATVWNFTIRGMDNYDITDIRYDPKEMKFIGKMEFDPLSIHTVYVTNGNLAGVPVEGHGTAQLAIGPINGTFEIAGKMKIRKSVDYYDPVDVKIKVTVDDVSFSVEGLFGDDVEHATLTNELLNQNSRMILEAGTPVIERITEKFLMRYLKWLMRTYPYYKLFPQAKN